MNTKASVAYGWGILVAAGGGAYYFAKRSINADRLERAETEEKRRQSMQRLQYGNPPPPKKADRHASPGNDAHEGEVSPAAGHVEDVPTPKFASKEPFRSKKGDRFS